MTSVTRSSFPRPETRSPTEPPPALGEAEMLEAAALLAKMAEGLFPDGASAQLLTWVDEIGTTIGADPRGIEERLKAAEMRFRTLMEQIPAVTFMAVLGEGDNEMYVSSHIEQMLGYSQEEWLSDPFLWYTRLHPDDRVLWNAEFTRGVQTGGPFKAECRFMARNGNVVWVHGEARLVKDERGRPQFLQGVAFDITESKRAQELLLESAVKTARMQEELAIAQRVQTSLLPVDPSLEGLDIAPVMLPAEDVGGDYYDIRPLEGGSGFVTVGDVSGHGLDAGLVMLMVQSAIAAILAARPDASPTELLVLLNRVIYDNVARRLSRRDYVTLCALRYARDGRIVFAGAHQDILVYRSAARRLERIRTTGPWMGIVGDVSDLTTDDSFRLEHRDLLVLFTDGVVESMNEAGEQFDMHRLCAAIEEVHEEPPARIRDHIVRKVGEWTYRQDDDVTVLVARYTSA
ncbi:MAG TPA: SpoIIE family protein phosphatase [Polyangiaceae bacterium]|nr:SpoIIE family protein phosphatase [Polyangiaceae bacterium]